MPQTVILSGSTERRAATASSRFGCTLRDGGRDAAWLRVTGELDIATAPQLAQMLNQAQQRARRVVLDLRELTVMDSVGVHVIVDATLRATAAGRRLVLVRGPSQVDRVFDLARVAATLEIIDLDPIEPPVQALLELAKPDRAG